MESCDLCGNSVHLVVRDLSIYHQVHKVKSTKDTKNAGFHSVPCGNLVHLVVRDLGIYH